MVVFPEASARWQCFGFGEIPLRTGFTKHCSTEHDPSANISVQYLLLAYHHAPMISCKCQPLIGWYITHRIASILEMWTHLSECHTPVIFEMHSRVICGQDIMFGSALTTKSTVSSALPSESWAYIWWECSWHLCHPCYPHHPHPCPTCPAAFFCKSLLLQNYFPNLFLTSCIDGRHNDPHSHG